MTNIMINTPANRINGAISVILNAMICAVMVVPMLAPIPTLIACISDMSPALTNPTSITVVADELWMTAVTPAPTPTAANLFFVSFSSPSRSLSPAMASRPSDISFMPYRKSPRPPSTIAKSQKSIYIPSN